MSQQLFTVLIDNDKPKLTAENLLVSQISTAKPHYYEEFRSWVVRLTLKTSTDQAYSEYLGDHNSKFVEFTTQQRAKDFIEHLLLTANAAQKEIKLPH